MSQDTIAVELEDRKILGKGLNKIRAEGKVPAVIHDHGKDSIHVMGNGVSLNKAYTEAGKHHPVEIAIGKQNHLALIKDVDFDPIKHNIRHIVFQAINRNQKTEAEIPVVLEGDAPAEIAGFMVITQLDHVEVEALPSDLPDELKVDASVLSEVGDRIHVSDIKAPGRVEILTDPELTIAVVEESKAQLAEEETAEETEGVDASDVPSEHGGDTDQAAQDSEDQPGGKKQNQPKGE